MILRWLLLVLTLPLLLAARCDGKDVQEHVLSRIGYGPDPWTVARYAALGARGYVEEQLRPHTIDDSALEAILTRYPTLDMAYADLRRHYHEYGGGVTTAIREVGYAKILRAVYSRRQLEQVLVDFWFNHFNVSIRRDLVRWSATPYERNAIRPHVLGRFEDMLKASAHSLAMINYLDNQENFRDGFQHRPAGRVLGINENYARELLELHTLGVEAPYTLEDIQEVARAFTGWSTYNFVDLPLGSDGFLYIAAGHDDGAKTIMGELFIPAGGGMEDGDAVLEYLASHPRTAERVARKLCVRFVSETPPEALVQQAKNVFLSTDGDLYQVMRTILRSDAFLKPSPAEIRSKVKRPLAFVASTARAVGVANIDVFVVNAYKELEALGESTHSAEPPTGYPEASAAWVSEGSFLRRVNYAYSAAHGALGFAPLPPIAGTPEEVVSQLERRFFVHPIAPETRAALIPVVQGHSAASRVGAAAATLLASPEFQSQ